MREEQPRFEGWLPASGHVEIRCRMTLSPRSMGALWLAGFEDDDEQLQCGELCVVEIFGSSVRDGSCDEAWRSLRAEGRSSTRVAPAKRRRDAETLLALFGEVTGEPPMLQGTVIGFGSYHYRYASGREGTPRRPASLREGGERDLPGRRGRCHASDLARLGPHTSGVGCLYVKDLERRRPRGARADRGVVVPTSIRRRHLRLARARAPSPEPCLRSGTGRKASRLSAWT